MAAPDRIAAMARHVLRAATLLAAAVCAGATHAADPRDESVPRFSASQRCPGDGSPEMKYDCDFLKELGAKPLEAPLGGRAYRETWAGPFAGPTGRGSITLRITADGMRTLEAPWLKRPYRLNPGELPDFEATLAKSRFDKWTVYNRREGIWVDGVATSIEAVVDGKYRLVLFDYSGGVFDEAIAQALDQLFVFTAGLKGLKYPVDSDHPTYRG
jgi:hypothetical protein